MEKRNSWYSWVDKLPADTSQEKFEELLYDYQDHTPYYDDVGDED